MAIRLEQQAQATIGGAALSVNFTLGTAPTLGNILICAWEHNDSTNPVMSGTGVTWTRQNLFVGDASHDNIALYTGVVNAGASVTQTFTQNSSLANAAGILLEFSGAQQILDGTPPTPTNLSSATPSITSNSSVFPADLVVAFMGNVGNNAPTAAPSGWQTVTAASNTRRIDGAYNLTAQARGTVSAQWSYSGSQFALAEIVLVQAAPAGTTTSTSSTSMSSTSISSTSTSVSSTSSSTSTSSTSTSVTTISTSSTSSSISTSSTSSSISSTSSSISSTSLSSTSSSTSISSTSSSISSTSQSSTSLSSTSSSTSISSTSTSFSSTSSSVSSTSRSTSSTSFSSTSSSSSTSTTTVPSNLEYTYEDKLTLPTGGTDLLNPFTNLQYGNVSVDDGDYFVEYGSEYMIGEYELHATNNTNNIKFTWRGRTSSDTRVSPMLIQIFNNNSSAWETLATINTVPADTDLSVSVIQSTNLSNYYASDFGVLFRSYQQVI